MVSTLGGCGDHERFNFQKFTLQEGCGSHEGLIFNNLNFERV